MNKEQFTEYYRRWIEAADNLSDHIQRIRAEYITKVRIYGEHIGVLRMQHKELIRRNPRSDGAQNVEADRLLKAISDAEAEINALLDTPSMMTDEEETLVSELFLTAIQAYNETAFAAKQLAETEDPESTPIDRSHIDRIVTLYRKFVQMGCDRYALMEYPNEHFMNGVELAFLEAVGV